MLHAGDLSTPFKQSFVIQPWAAMVFQRKKNATWWNPILTSSIFLYTNRNLNVSSHKPKLSEWMQSRTQSVSINSHWNICTIQKKIIIQSTLFRWIISYFKHSFMVASLECRLLQWYAHLICHEITLNNNKGHETGQAINYFWLKMWGNAWKHDDYAISNRLWWCTGKITSHVPLTKYLRSSFVLYVLQRWLVQSRAG